MDNRRIGLFDSGLGGLTVMKEMMEVLPRESIVYFGDTGRVPYGGKSVETIVKYTKSDIRFLETFDLKLVIAACGTASAIALPRIRGFGNVPVMGVTEATARVAASMTKNGIVGVIGTEGTIRSGAFCELLQKENPAISCISVACPLFVPLVESGFADKKATRLIAEEYLEPIIENGADTLILGCTHYPLLTKVIAEIVGDKVTLVNPGACAAKEIEAWLAAQDMLAEAPKTEQYHFYVSDTPEGFERLGSMFLERPIGGALSRVDIEAYTEAG